MSEEEMRSGPEWGGPEFSGQPGGWVGVELVGFVEIVGARLPRREVQGWFAA